MKPLIGATWNILHGTFSDQVLASVDFLISEKHVDFLCLQEAQIEDKINSFLSGKFPEWRSIHIHAKTSGHELAILWNSTRLRILDEPRLIFLPVLEGSSIFEHIFFKKRTWQATQRAAMTAQFSVDGQELRITNVHASFEGGYFHRLRQFNFLARMLHSDPVKHEILCGDFNTPSYGPLLWRFQQRTVQRALGSEFINATPDLAWSFDLQTIDPYQPTAFLAKFPLWLRKLARSRMDYIFGRNMKILKGEMIDLSGSDHRPLLASFDFIV